MKTFIVLSLCVLFSSCGYVNCKGGVIISISEAKIYNNDSTIYYVKLSSKLSSPDGVIRNDLGHPTLCFTDSTGKYYVGQVLFTSFDQKNVERMNY